MSTDDDAKLHWEAARKYALEVLRTLVIINGAAAVSVLTFMGNTKITRPALISSMACFAIGVIFSVIAQALAYFTDREYGNASAQQVFDASKWKKGAMINRWSVCVAVAGLVSFAVGVVFAAVGLRGLT